MENHGNEIIELLSSDSEDALEVMKNWIIVPGAPKAMPRASFMAWPKNGKLFRRVVNKAKSNVVQFGEDVKAILAQKYGYGVNSYPLYPTGGVVLSLAFYRRMPTSAFKGRDRSREYVGGRYGPESNWPDMMKPDVDNLAKFVMDALQGIVYSDDDQVVILGTIKMMDTRPPGEGSTEVTFSRLNRMHDLNLEVVIID